MDIKRQDLQEQAQALLQGKGVEPLASLECAGVEFISEMNREGNAIGGLSVGAPHDMMYEMTSGVCEILPYEKPRYLMG